MKLEDYFEFLALDDIRIKGHRIGIETVLVEYLHRKRSAEEIQRLYPTLSLEEVYATILYYLHNQEQAGRYVADWLDFSRQAHQEAQTNPSPARMRLTALRAEIEAYAPNEREAARKHIRERECAAHAPDETVKAA